jgi:hypothetical protein
VKPDRSHPCFSERPLKAKSESARPSHEAASKAQSFGTKKNRLGESEKRTLCTKLGTGRIPPSPRSGTNWFLATRKAMK